MYQRERPNVSEIVPLANSYHLFPGCGAGGSLHIVIDDPNFEDESIQYCIECARNPGFWVCRDHYDGHDEAGELLGRLLLLMSITQRRQVHAMCDGGYGNGPYLDRPSFLLRCRELLKKYESAPGVPGILRPTADPKTHERRHDR